MASDMLSNIARLQVPLCRSGNQSSSKAAPASGHGTLWRTRDLLAVQWGSTPALGLLHHGGLVAQGNSNTGCRKLAGLTVHLHRDGLGSGEQHFSALGQPLAVPTHLQCCLWAQDVQVRCWMGQALLFPEMLW